ncbi:MAG: class I SAM-dependent methyltransferase [bacterium]
MKDKTWYEDWFSDEHYLALYRHRDTEEAGEVLDLIERSTGVTKESAILDLACGAGRYSIALAKRGYQHITAIDLSPTLIAEAKRNAEVEGVTIDFIHDDMRDFDGSFDLIVNLFTSFGYFQTDVENSDVITHISKHLNSGGKFVLDFFNAEFVVNTLSPYDEKQLRSGERVELYRKIINHRVEKRIIIHSTGSTKEYHESVRLFDLDDFANMFESNGLRVIHCFGDYDGSPFEQGSSPRLFLVAQKNG